jgi:hypothetical protein
MDIWVKYYYLSIFIFIAAIFFKNGPGFTRTEIQPLQAEYWDGLLKNPRSSTQNFCDFFKIKINGNEEINIVSNQQGLGILENYLLKEGITEIKSVKLLVSNYGHKKYQIKVQTKLKSDLSLLIDTQNINGKVLIESFQVLN